MYVSAKNENYGYSVATHGKYVAVGNPPLVRYTGSSPAFYPTGSVDVFKYDINTDTHLYVETLYKPSSVDDILLASEIASVISDILHTELTGSDYTKDKDLEVDIGNYLTMIENDYGFSLDWYNKKLAIGCRYYWEQAVIGSQTFDASGSCVDVWDYTYTEGTPYVSYSGSQVSASYYRINNPHLNVTTSFGHAVSINRDWMAVGSPLVSGSKGTVYIYKNECTGSILSWSFYQKLEPTSLIPGQKFGWDLALNKSINFECPNRLVVGCGAANNNTVYLFEFSGSSWYESYQFHQQTGSLYPLTFDSISYPILHSASYQSSSFGSAVSMWEDTVVIGAPRERVIYEFTGSSLYEQGTAYIFERCSDISCPVTQSNYYLAKKVYGDEYTLKNNRLGYSVSIYGDNMMIGIPKRNLDTMTPCYINGSLIQQNYCSADLENTIHGQWMYLTKNTSSNNWEIEKVFQKKKKFLSPYRAFGHDVSIADFSAVVGAPMLLSGSERQIEIPYTASTDVSLDDIMGKTYIYNLKNYRETFHVGNVFYRNGILVVNTSGSALDGLFFNPTSPYNYEYALDYKSRHTINEKQIVCTVEPGEFNVSTNPTAVVKATSSLDLNKNGIVDFQDVDILLRYMQYKNSTILGGYSFDWSSSIVKNDDEISFYNYNAEFWTNTDSLFSSSLLRFETVDTWYADLLDFNEDSKIDINDINILWKYFSNRLTERNYMSYITINSRRQQLSDALTYMDGLSRRRTAPLINTLFSNYDNLCVSDPTGSYLSPMVTTIGLYSGLDLVAVAKLGSPIKLPKTLPINFVVKMDF